MTESTSDDNRAIANVRATATSSTPGFQKLNGGNWEKVSLTSTPLVPLAEEEIDRRENGFPMRLMKFIGLPQAYRHSIYHDYIEEVQEIPSETASTFHDLVSWICGSSEPASTDPTSKTATDESLQNKTSTDSILTCSESRITTPYQLSQTNLEDKKDVNIDDLGHDLCWRLPSLLLIKPSQCALHTEATTVYSCQVTDDNPPQFDGQQSVKDVHAMHQLEQNKADSRNLADNTGTPRVSNQNLQWSESDYSMYSNTVTGSLPSGSDAVPLPSDDVPLPSVAVALPSDAVALSSEAVALSSDAVALSSDAVALPSDAVALSSEAAPLPSEAVTLPSDAAPLPSDAAPLPSDAAPLPSETVPLPSETVPLPDVFKNTISLPRPSSAIPLQYQLSPPSSTSIPLPISTPPDPTKPISKTTSEIQLNLNQDLQALQDVVKKLYKNLNKTGPLTIVANFQQRPNGELDIDMNVETSEDERLKEKRVPPKPKKTLKKNLRTDSHSDRDSSEKEESDDTKPQAEVKSSSEVQEKKNSVKDFRQEQLWKYTPSQTVYISEPLVSPEHKPSISVLPTMIPSEKRFSVNPALQVPGSRIKLDVNENIGASGSRPPILKVSSSKTEITNRISVGTFTVLPTQVEPDISGYSPKAKETQRPHTTGNILTSFISEFKEEASSYPLNIPQHSNSGHRKLSFNLPTNKLPPQPHQNKPLFQSQKQQLNKIGGWNHPGKGNPLQNMRIVKACNTHEKNSPLNHSYFHHRYEQEGQEEESDESTSETSPATTSDEGTGLESGSENVDSKPNYEFKHRHQRLPARTGPRLETAKSKSNVLKLDQTSTQQQQKFRGMVFIPPASGVEKRNDSFTRMFDEKPNQKIGQQQNRHSIVVDLTARGSGKGNALKKDPVPFAVPHRSIIQRKY